MTFPSKNHDPEKKSPNYPAAGWSLVMSHGLPTMWAKSCESVSVASKAVWF